MTPCAPCRCPSLHAQAHQFIYPTLSGVLGAQSVLFAKSTAELLKSAFRASDGDEPSPFASPMTYVIIVCMFSTIFMQLHWLAVALQWFDAVYCIPVFQVCIRASAHMRCLQRPELTRWLVCVRPTLDPASVFSSW